MKRTAALLMLTLLLLRPLLSVRAETALSVTRDSYGLRVSSIDLVTSINGKYTVVKQTRTTGRIADAAQVTYEYDFEQETPECVGRFEEDAPVALVTVDGFSEELASIQDPDRIVITVNGQPVAAPEGAAYGEAIGWQNANLNGLYCAVFPILLTKEGGETDCTVCVQAVLDGVRVTETARITVVLKNIHEYKPERVLRIAALDGQNVDAYLLGDRIYFDHPSTAVGEPRVRITFSDETGAPFTVVAWAGQTACAQPGQSAALRLKEECRLEQSRTEYLLDAAADPLRSSKVVFCVETQEALYRSPELTLVQRFDVPPVDPKGIFFAQSAYTLPVGGVLEPIVLGVATGEPVRTNAAGVLELLPGPGTDAQVLDVTDGKTVIGVQPGTAYLTARYTLGDRVYDAASARITVCGPIQRMTVLCRNLNVRSGAGTDHPILGRVHRGDALQVVSVAEGWAQLIDGTYVCAQYIAR